MRETYTTRPASPSVGSPKRTDRTVRVFFLPDISGRSDIYNKLIDGLVEQLQSPPEAEKSNLNMIFYKLHDNRWTENVSQAFPDSIEKLAQSYIPDIPENFYQDMLLFVGYSSAGTVALELLNLLLKTHDGLSAQALLLDTPHPSVRAVMDLSSQQRSIALHLRTLLDGFSKLSVLHKTALNTCFKSWEDDTFENIEVGIKALRNSLELQKKSSTLPADVAYNALIKALQTIVLGSISNVFNYRTDDISDEVWKRVSLIASPITASQECQNEAALGWDKIPASHVRLLPETVSHDSLVRADVRSTVDVLSDLLCTTILDELQRKKIFTGVTSQLLELINLGMEENELRSFFNLFVKQVRYDLADGANDAESLPTVPPLPARPSSTPVPASLFHHASNSVSGSGKIAVKVPGP